MKTPLTKDEVEVRRSCTKHRREQAIVRPQRSRSGSFTGMYSFIQIRFIAAPSILGDDQGHSIITGVLDVGELYNRKRRR